MTAPIVLTGKVVGVEEVTAHLRGSPNKARQLLTVVIRRLGIQLQNKVRFQFLSGQSLKVKTGRLRNSINEKLITRGDTILSQVGTAVPYGRFWEKGFSGTENVRAYVRRQKSRNVRASLEGKRKKTIAQGIAFVRAHPRHVTVAARPFLRPALQEMRPTIRETITEALRQL